MPEDANDYLRLMLQELKALNVRLDRTLDRVDSLRSELKAEWRSEAKRFDAARSETHTDLSVLRGELMQIRGVISSRDATVEESSGPAGDATKAKTPRPARKGKAAPKARRASTSRKKA
jgi:hypothetical protein